MITWVVGVTKNGKTPIDINKTLMMRPDFQDGDIAVKYGMDKKATLPKSALIENLKDRIIATNQNFEVGNVVKHKLTDKEMTIIWIVGQTQQSSYPVNINKMYEMNGFQNGDIVCGFFKKKEYKKELFRKGEVIKIYE